MRIYTEGENQMLSKVFGAGIFGIEGYSVTVECNANDRLPAFNIVGLPDAAIKESKERIKAAVINSGFFFPDAEITVNLAPADKKKESHHTISPSLSRS